MKRALITGVTGQDGAYLAEFLLNKGYEVHGIKRRASLFNTSRIDHLYRDPHEKDVRFFLHHGDLTDASNLIRIIQQTLPDEIYNLAGQSHVAVSFEVPEYTANTNAARSAALVLYLNTWPSKGSLLSGLDIGAVWADSGQPAKRTNALSSTVALCRSQAVRILDHGQLPRSLRDVCVQRNLVQS